MAKLAPYIIETIAAVHFADVGQQNVHIAVAVALAESGGEVEARGDNFASGHQAADSPYRWDFGLMQINSVHGFNSERLTSDPDYNMRCARVIWGRQGWPAWTTFRVGAHSRHLPRQDELSKPLSLGGWFRLSWEAYRTQHEFDSHSSWLRLRKVDARDRYYTERR